jgi:integrase
MPRVPPVCPREAERAVTKRVKFTQDRVASITPPAHGEIHVPDSEQPGLQLRVRSTGAKTWVVRYRLGGRGTRQPRLTIGPAAKVGVKAAREVARHALDKVASGHDPAADAKVAQRKTASQLDRAVADYIAHLNECQASPVNVGKIKSLLERELVAAVGPAVQLDDLNRQKLAERIEAVVASGRLGAARELKTRASVFFGWAASRGLIVANPLAGFRLPRATKAQALERKGQALLTDDSIRALWLASAASDDPIFVTFVRAVLLTGCRRSELAAAQWSWVRELDAVASLVIPRAATKNGQEHEVPLPGVLLKMLRALPRAAGNDLIFPGRNGRLISGWTKRWAPVAKALTAEGLRGVTLHDLRRTARSWWARVGTADEKTYELMLNHRPRNVLISIYDLEGRWPQRVATATAWTEKVIEITSAEAGGLKLNVVGAKSGPPLKATL